MKNFSLLTLVSLFLTPAAFAQAPSSVQPPNSDQKVRTLDVEFERGLNPRADGSFDFSFGRYLKGNDVSLEAHRIVALNDDLTGEGGDGSTHVFLPIDIGGKIQISGDNSQGLNNHDRLVIESPSVSVFRVAFDGSGEQDLLPKGDKVVKDDYIGSSFDAVFGRVSYRYKAVRFEDANHNAIASVNGAELSLVNMSWSTPFVVTTGDGGKGVQVDLQTNVGMLGTTFGQIQSPQRTFASEWRWITGSSIVKLTFRNKNNQQRFSVFYQVDGSLESMNESDYLTWGSINQSAGAVLHYGKRKKSVSFSVFQDQDMVGAAILANPGTMSEKSYKQTRQGFKLGFGF